MLCSLKRKCNLLLGQRRFFVGKASRRGVVPSRNFPLRTA